MGILHLVSINLNLSPIQHERLLAVCRDGDAVVLLGPGVYTLSGPTTLPAPVYVLDSDCAASGLNPPATIATTISYAAFVGLCERHERSLAWH